MPISTRQIDNIDTLPPGSQLGEIAPWQPLPRARMGWAEIVAAGGVFTALLLIVWWLIGADVRYWIGYSWGGLVVKSGVALGFVAVAIAIVRRAVLVNQRGYQVPLWDISRVLPQLIEVDSAFAGTPGRMVRAQTIQYPAKLELPPPVEAMQIIDAGPALIPDSEWLAWIDRTPHLLLAGRTDAGKTALGEAILVERVMAGDQIVICDPHYQPSKWCGIEATANIEAILSQLARLEQELATRFDAFNAGKPTDDFQRLTILLDEVPAIVEETFRMSPAGTKKIVDDRWARFARRLGSQARKVRISVILLSQTIFVEDLMINSAYRENFIRVGMGDKARPLLAEEKRAETRNALYELLRGQAHPAAFEHNGEIHLLDTSRVVALASRRIGHMAQLWTPPPQIARAVVSASVQTDRQPIVDRVSMAVPSAPQPQTDRQTTKLTPDRKRALIAAMRTHGRTRREARSILARMGEGLDNDDWAEVG